MSWMTQRPYVLVVAAWLLSLCLGPWIASPWLTPDWVLVAMAILFIQAPQRVSLDVGVLAAVLAALTAMHHPGRTAALYLAVWLGMMGVLARLDLQQPRAQWLAIAGLLGSAHAGWVMLLGRPTLALLGAASVKALITLGAAWAIARWVAPSTRFR